MNLPFTKRRGWFLLPIVTCLAVSCSPANAPAPAAPSELRVVAVGDTNTSLTWTPGIGEIPAATYHVFEDDRDVTTVDAPSATVSGLVAATAYQFTVRAYSAAGAPSGPSPAVHVTTLATSSPPDQPVGPSGPWAISFEDSFDGASLDTSKWSTGFGWGQYNNNDYSADCEVPENVIVSGGLLQLKAENRAPTTGACAASGKAYASAAVNTKAHFAQEYGYFETRMRPATVSGMFDAFWGKPVTEQWPPEMDFTEFFGSNPRAHRMTLHWDDPAIPGLDQRNILGFVAPNDLAAGFNIYGVEWTPDLITYYFNGVKMGSHSTSPGDGAAYMRGQFYLTFNLYVCAAPAYGWCGNPAGVTWGDATTLFVDWVRVWRRPPQP